MANNNEIVLFTSSDGEISLPVNLEEETIWLSQAQLAELFGRSQPVIARHISNISKEGERDLTTSMHFLHNPSSYALIQFYDLNDIISIGYRVKSQRGVEFRRWATNVLRQFKSAAV